MTDYGQNDQRNRGVGEVFLSQSAKSSINSYETLYPRYISETNQVYHVHQTASNLIIESSLDFVFGDVLQSR
jgi:hypothetical protein